MMSLKIDLNEAEISQRLAAARPESLPPENKELQTFFPGELRPAAVLLPLLRAEGGWQLLFTRRTDGLAEHSGQVAFPGGSTDPEDASSEHTALREAQEEIGLEPADVRILGRLRQSITITRYLVTPVVGVIPWPYPLRLAHYEVGRAFTIPLDWLADPANREQRLRTLSPDLPPVPVIYYRPYDGEVLWGASARFTINLLEALNC
jgi:8-oxo-dGTP pyrophosphatase MutT (NUDIX family)